MVTHNPELAEKYSTRIIRMLDGSLTDDSVPLTEKEVQLEQVQDQMSQEQEKRIKRNLPCRLGLHFCFLFEKSDYQKGRTALTSFAGSIGIIGIALVYAVSQGFTEYIDDVQENALSSYPLTIEKLIRILAPLWKPLWDKQMIMQIMKIMPFMKILPCITL